MDHCGEAVFRLGREGRLGEIKYIIGAGGGLGLILEFIHVHLSSQVPVKAYAVRDQSLVANLILAVCARKLITQTSSFCT